MTDYQAGDLATLRLRVTPDDEVPTDDSTSATVRVVGPSGQVRTPTAQPNTARDRWAAPLVLDEPGEWSGRWTVTGTGAGVQPFTLLVGPAGADASSGGRTYATTADLARYLGAAPPAGSLRLLERATELVDDAIIAAVYNVDDGMPVDEVDVETLRDAVCAQVAWWGETGDDTGSGAAAAFAGGQIGSVKLPNAGTSTGTDPRNPLAPAAVRRLRAGGMLTGRAYVAGWAG